MKAPGSRSRRPRSYQKHGLTSLKAAVNKLGGRVIDRRTTLGKALDAWRGELVADLGGRGAISTQQLALVDLAVRTKLMLDSIDSWILTQPTLINARKRTLIPVVRERVSVASQFQGLMKDLGLERRARQVPSLSEYLSSRRLGPEASRGPDTEPNTSPATAAAIQAGAGGGGA